MFKVKRELLIDVPEEIKIEEIPKYLNPKRMEVIFNNILEKMDFNQMLSEVGKEIENSTEKIRKKTQKNENVKEDNVNIDL